MPGHTTDDYYILKYYIQYLIDSSKIEDPEKQPNVKTNPLPNYPNMPPPASYAISLELPKSFVENSIQDFLENETMKLKREERELLAILEADFVGVIK